MRVSLIKGVSQAVTRYKRGCSPSREPHWVGKKKYKAPTVSDSGEGPKADRVLPRKLTAIGVSVAVALKRFAVGYKTCVRPPTARDMFKKGKLFHQTLIFSYSEPTE